MKIIVTILLVLLVSCTTINVQPPAMTSGGNYTVTIDASKQIPFNASDNTVPIP